MHVAEPGMGPSNTRGGRSRRLEELLAASEEFQAILREEVERLPNAKPMSERRERGNPRGDTLVCAAIRKQSSEEEAEGNFSVVTARNPFVVTFEPSFNFKNQPRVHPQRFPADIVFDNGSSDAVFQTSGGALVDIAMAGGVGLFLSLGDTASGKSQKYQDFLSKTVNAVLEKCRWGQSTEVNCSELH